MESVVGREWTGEVQLMRQRETGVQTLTSCSLSLQQDPLLKALPASRPPTDLARSPHAVLQDTCAEAERCRRTWLQVFFTRA